MNNKGRIIPAEMHEEIARTAKVRCSEHHAALIRKKNSNLWEHVEELHNQ